MAGKPSPLTMRERIARRVRITDTGCWEWQGCVQANGYGRIGVYPERKTDYTHRVAYREFVGEIPDGLTLDHLCKNTRCCNPEHLEPVTPVENWRRGDAVTVAHSLKTVCPRCGGEYTEQGAPNRRRCIPCRKQLDRDRKREQRVREREQRV